MSNNKQSSSVEWLFEELFNSFEKFNNGAFSFAEYMAHNLKLRKQAKEKHKEEMLYAIEWGNRKGYDEHKLTCIYDEDEQYYKEVFGDNNE